MSSLASKRGQHLLVPASVFPKEEIPAAGGWFAAVIGPSTQEGCCDVQFAGERKAYYFPEDEVRKWVITAASPLASKAERALRGMELQSPSKRKKPKRATPAAKASTRRSSGGSRGAHSRDAADTSHAAAAARPEPKPAASSAAIAEEAPTPAAPEEKPSASKRAASVQRKRKSEAAEPDAAAARTSAPAAPAPADAQGTAPPEQQETEELPGRAAQRARVEAQHGGWGEKVASVCREVALATSGVAALYLALQTYQAAQ